MGRVNKGSSGAENTDEIKTIAAKIGENKKLPIMMSILSGSLVLCFLYHIKAPMDVTIKVTFCRKSLMMSRDRPAMRACVGKPSSDHGLLLGRAKRRMDTIASSLSADGVFCQI